MMIESTREVAPARAVTPSGPAILITAFEPSGDAHAAPLIRTLRSRYPDQPIVALGGPKMAAAGADLLEETAADGSMGLNALGRIAAVRRSVNTIRAWLRSKRLLLHIAVDSPAANFPICKVTKRAGAKVAHLVAPQMWAWGSWRIKKLRRLTDLVLCLLPFEEEWFTSRDVPARFIGHPTINRPLDLDALRDEARSLPSGGPKIAIFPGSRSHEVEANLGLLVKVYTELNHRQRGTAGLIVAANDALGTRIRRKIGTLPPGLHVSSGNADVAIAWCDFALNVSGTVSLDIARQTKPMVAVYRTGWVSALGAKLLLKTPCRLLPNIIAGREIVPEFIPHAGGAGAVIDAAAHLMEDSKHLAIQSEALRRVLTPYEGHVPEEEAADAIANLLKGEEVAHVQKVLQ